MHPFSSGDQEAIKRRAVVVEIKNCGSIITDLRLENGVVMSEIETMSSFMGPSLYNAIVNDKINLGFSLRAFSQVKPHPHLENVMLVTAPLKAITYDVVSNPSHKLARITTFTTESEQLRSLLNESDEQLVTEADELLLNDGIKHPDTSQKLIADYLNEMVRSKYTELRNITFKIG
ncbi:MAG: hypothetical protein H7836_04720 [Magnetococcus sp. YQC-3]